VQGFGRTIGIDYGLVIPTTQDPRRRRRQTLADGELRGVSGRSRGIRPPARCPAGRSVEGALGGAPALVIEGEGSWEDGKWYGLARFFDWLETKSYRMHIRVLLSRYRVYRECPSCGGARLKPEALLWRLGGSKTGAPGHTIRDVTLLPIDRCRDFFEELTLPAPLDEAAGLLLKEIKPDWDISSTSDSATSPWTVSPAPSAAGGAEDQPHHRARNFAREHPLRS